MTDSECRVIVLVISRAGASNRWDKERAVWLRIARSTPPCIRVHLLEGDASADTDVVMRCPFKDSYTPGIYKKTVFGVKTTLSMYPKAEFIVRTNLSTFILWSRLIEYLTIVRPTYSGVRVNPGQWVNGWGIVMNRTIASLFVSDHAQRSIDATSVPDDVMIGRVLNEHGFPCMMRDTTIRDYPLISYLWRYDLSLADNTKRISTKPDCVFIRLHSYNFDAEKYKGAVLYLIGSRHPPWRSRISLSTSRQLSHLHKVQMQNILSSKKKSTSKT